MRKTLLALIGSIVVLMLVAGCGKKGPLEAPDGSTAETSKTNNDINPTKTGPMTTPAWPSATSQDSPH